MQIPDFIGRKMDYPEMKRFLEHVDTCANCREELVIQFLIQEGMARLEDGDAFDLQRELQAHLEEARRRIRIRCRKRQTAHSLPRGRKREDRKKTI